MLVIFIPLSFISVNSSLFVMSFSTFSIIFLSFVVISLEKNLYVFSLPLMLTVTSTMIDSVSRSISFSFLEFKLVKFNV